MDGYNSWAHSVQISIPENKMGSPTESLVTKNIFTEKYDEIRRLDGIFTRNMRLKNKQTV